MEPIMRRAMACRGLLFEFDDHGVLAEARKGVTGVTITMHV